MRGPPPIRAPPIFPAAACAPALVPGACCASTGVATASESVRAVAPKTPNLVILYLQDCEAKPTASRDDRSGASQTSGPCNKDETSQQRIDDFLKISGGNKEQAAPIRKGTAFPSGNTE